MPLQFSTKLHSIIFHKLVKDIRVDGASYLFSSSETEMPNFIFNLLRISESNCKVSCVIIEIL